MEDVDTCMRLSDLAVLHHPLRQLAAINYDIKSSMPAKVQQ